MKLPRTRIVITGAGGFLGSFLGSALVRLPNAEVIAFVRQRESTIPLARSVKVELTQEGSVAEALRAARPDIVLHAAGRVHGTARELFLDNSVATVALANAMLRACPEAVLTTLGSAAEYGPSLGQVIRDDTPCRPVSVYGHSKLAGAAYLASATERGLKYNLIRVFNPVGLVNSPDQVLGAFISKALRARAEGLRVVRMSRLDAVRDFVVIDDIAQLVLSLVAGRSSGHVVNACSGYGYPVRDLIHFLVAASGDDFKVVEEGSPPPESAPPDVVVGDPRRFKALAGLSELSSVEATLAAAWPIAAHAQVA